MKVSLGPPLAVALLSLGCGSWQREGSSTPPDRGETLTQILDVQAAFKRIGRLTAGSPLPFVASVSFLGGVGDTTVAIIGISLSNRSFGFQRDGNDFVAHYRVDLTAQAQGRPPVTLGKDQTVRVPSFDETQRVDESILFQDALLLPAGPHHFAVAIRDRDSQNSTRAEGDFVVPAFPTGSVSAPILTYRAKGRVSRSDPIGILVNPRGALSYGGDTALAYVEAYNRTGPDTIPFILVDVDDSVIAQEKFPIVGGRPVESFVYRFSPEAAPLGELKLIVGKGADEKRSSALVAFSGAWVTSNYEDMVGLLRYFPASDYLDSLRDATPENRSERWRAFYHGTDPNPATPTNEMLDQYFARVALANQRFTDEGVAGWRTDRGEVLIRIGEPDEVFDASPLSEGRIIRWGYTQYQLTLFFSDDTGFGRFKLTQASRADFERIAARLSREAG